MKSVSRWLAMAVIAGVGVAHAADLVIYDDALENGFSTDDSYFGGLVVGSTTQAHSGSKSIAFTGQSGMTAFNALAFTGPTSYSTDTYPVLHFWVYGSAPGGQSFDVEIYADRNSGVPDKSASLNSFVSGGAVGNGVWREVTMNLTQPPLSYTGTFDRIDIQSETSSAQPTIYIDDVSLQSSVVDEIFANSFEGGTAPPPPSNSLVETPNQSNGGMNAELFTWYDSNAQQRTTALAYNNGASGPGGSHGGEMRQFSYHVGTGVRTVNASSSAFAGFGYVVSHPTDDEACTGGGDSSSLGHFTAGTFTRVFQGRHHAIFRFQQNYPRYCTTGAAAEHDIPVTIDWSFSTGRDNPLWSISYDLSSVGADVLDDDSRAPYGELLFDGSASEGAHSTIAGVGWGDGYKFQSTTNPVTYDSAWTWNVLNTIPYVKLWTTAIDATMGTVQTQTLAQQDAGGYFDASRWNTTSAAGVACASDDGDPHSMPCSGNWDYQSINYSMGEAIGGSNSEPTNNTRLAWGTEFGFLGQSSYHVNGSTYWGGPRADTLASGYPRKSYSTYIVLGVHSSDAVEAQVAQVEAMQTLALTQTTGTIATSGPAGVNRSDTITYSPAGYDPVYGAITFAASANKLDVTLGTTKSLKNPLIIVRNYTAGAYPSTVQYDGATLTMDTDYFPSLRTDKSELWITLNRTVSTASNRLQITP